MGSGLNLGGYESDYASNTKSNFRKAGDAFTTASSREPSKESSYSKWMTFMGNQSSNSSNNSNNSNNSNTTTNSNNSQTTSNTNASAPQASQPVAGMAESGIDFKAWAADTASGDKSGGQDAAYWEKTYRSNNAKYEQNKALMESYQGAKSWDEFAARDQARKGDTKSQNQGTIADYGSLTTYLTAKQGAEHWEKASSKYQM